MVNSNSLDLLPGLDIDGITETSDGIEIHAHSACCELKCPACQVQSRRVHSYYHRTPLDLPIQDQRVRLVLRVRRFRCLNPDCERRTFAESLPDIERYSRRTGRLRTALEAIAFALGGEAGKRLSRHLKMTCSGDSLLRLVRRAPTPEETPTTVVGVDDWAQQRGRIYGTILVDLERHRPIDLLNDRSAEVLAAWLRAHPAVAVLARDRSLEYARGATLGAPQCQQVADRWHLLKNLREAIERLLDRLRPELLKLPALADPQKPVILDEIPAIRSADYSGHRLAQKQGRQARRQALFQAVHRLHEENLPIRQIAHTLNLGRMTVRKYLASTVCPAYAPRTPQPSLLDPYQEHLRQRWRQGCRNASELWREIQTQGFTGSRSLVGRWVRARREIPSDKTTNRSRPQFLASATSMSLTPTSTANSTTLPSSHQLVWVLLRQSGKRTELETSQWSRLRTLDIVARADDLAQRFLALVRERASSQLDEWLADAERSKVKELQTFAETLRKDYEAVKAACQSKWSNGQTEGQVNKLKLLKRQMYGRAKLDLLRARLLRSP